MDDPPPLRRGAKAIDTEALLADGRWLVAMARALLRHAGPRMRDLRDTIGIQSRSDPARNARETTASPPLLLDGAQEALERARLRRRVVESVLSLDEPCRSAVILRFFEARDVAGIARLTAARGETVRSHLRRGVERVRRLLERGVAPGVGSTAHEGVAALALLWARLRKIAARGGGGGAAGHVAASPGRANAAVTATRSRWPTLPIHRS